MTKLLITEITRMGPAFCVIGLQHDQQKFQSIRPISSTANSWLHFPYQRGEILECSPLSVRLTKESVMAGLALPVEEAMAADRKRLQVLLSSQDFREGPAAFAEKRKPNWTGR